MDKNYVPRNKELKNISKNLRNNATIQENHLWYDFLRTYEVRFNRQRIIGNYIADFYCAKARLVVELDGSQHFSNSEKQSDAERTLYFNGIGIKVIRFSNTEINSSFYEVCTLIDKEVKCRLNGSFEKELSPQVTED